MIDFREHLPVLIVLFPLFAAILMPLIGWKWQRGLYWVSFLSWFGAAACSLVGLQHVWTNGPILYPLGGWAPPIGIEWRLDGLSAFVSAIVSVAAFIILFGTRKNIQQEADSQRTAYYTCLHLMITGLLGITMAGDLFNVFVFLEVSALSSYALLGCGSIKGARAAYRYLLLGTLGASLYLLGVGFIYAVTGTLNMQDAALRLTGLWGNRMVIAGFGLMAVGLCIKSALFPLHGWMPNVYAYSPTTVATFIAPIMTKVSVYALLRIVGWVGVAYWDSESPLFILLRFAAIASIILGSLMARIQSNYRRLLAYSSIGQVGLIIVGISFASYTGLTGALLHLLNDVCSKAVFFLTACLLMSQTRAQSVFGLIRVRRLTNWYWVMFVIAGLSLVGIPPTLGFFSKWYLILAAFEQGQIWVAVIIAGSGLLSAAYVFVLIEQLFVQEEDPRVDEVGEPPPRISRRRAMATGFFAVSLLLLGIFNYPIAQLLVRVAMPTALTGNLLP